MGDSMKEVVEELDPIARQLVPQKIHSGDLIPLKTHLELKDNLHIGLAYVTRASTKLTNDVVNIVRDMVGEDMAKSLPHLRRCAKPTDLPPHLKTQFMNETTTGRAIHTGKSQYLYIMLGAKSDLDYDTLVAGLSSIEGIRDDLFIGQIPIPLLCPTSQVQANMWSQQFWPTVYRKNNPLGPHPSNVSRTTSVMARDADIWMALAHQVANQAHTAGLGEPIGVVIIKRTSPFKVDAIQADLMKGGKKPASGSGLEPSPQASFGDDAEYPAANQEGVRPSKAAGQTAADGASNGSDLRETTEIVALAGDARWHQQDNMGGTGNPVAHAAIRAISMVAQKLVRAENRAPVGPKPIQEFEGFQDKPLLPDEALVFESGHPSPDGYLCHDLELYMTHEPCIMCSMSILHSRVGRVMFRYRMPLTGGMCAEDRCVESCGSDGSHEDGSCGGGRAIGLHWRKELNWCMLGWEYSTDEQPPLPIDPHTHI